MAQFTVGCRQVKTNMTVISLHVLQILRPIKLRYGALQAFLFVLCCHFLSLIPLPAAATPVIGCSWRYTQ